LFVCLFVCFVFDSKRKKNETQSEQSGLFAECSILQVFLFNFYHGKDDFYVPMGGGIGFTLSKSSENSSEEE